ncbi:MAG: phosphotransferase family protein [Anaerolineae bacterium]|nr:phosphotransferase family protein [Anaerolineae bacterium]
MADRVAAMGEQLSHFLTGVAGEPVAVHSLRPVAGGASRETWKLTARPQGEEPFPLILRLDMAATMNPDALSRADEFHLLQLAHQAGIRCPRPFALCTDPAILGAPFFLMEYVPGESIGPRVVRRPELANARSVLARQMGQQLARIHRLAPPDALPRPAPRTSPAQHLVDALREALTELGIDSPGLETGLRWLERHAPPAPPELSLLHGDFRIGNIIVGEPGLAAIIDWEFAHAGDPLEDVAWPLVRDWRFGNDHLRLGGVAEPEPYLESYEAESGRTVDRAAVYYWEIMGNMKWAVTCLVQAERHLSGADPSVELASLGRRSAEMEYELLRLIAASG